MKWVIDCGLPSSNTWKSSAFKEEIGLETDDEFRNKDARESMNSTNLRRSR